MLLLHLNLFGVCDTHTHTQHIVANVPWDLYIVLFKCMLLRMSNDSARFSLQYNSYSAMLATTLFSNCRDWRNNYIFITDLSAINGREERMPRRQTMIIIIAFNKVGNNCSHSSRAMTAQQYTTYTETKTRCISMLARLQWEVGHNSKSSLVQ